MLAGMDQVAGPALAAAVTNAGGFGTLGGARYTPKMLREMIAEMKELLEDKGAAFGVDLLIPAVGGEWICWGEGDLGRVVWEMWADELLLG